MIHAAGYTVTYYQGAFRTKGSWEGSYNAPTRQQLDDAIKWATGSVASESSGRWVIVEKNRGLYPPDIAAEFTVFVPVGSQQYEQACEAVNRFDEIIGARLGADIDLDESEIEDYRSMCSREQCEQMPAWMRHSSQVGDKYFCAVHAPEELNFGTSDPLYFSWEQLDPANI